MEILKSNLFEGIRVKNGSWENDVRKKSEIIKSLRDRVDKVALNKELETFLRVAEIDKAEFLVLVCNMDGDRAMNASIYAIERKDSQGNVIYITTGLAKEAFSNGEKKEAPRWKTIKIVADRISFYSISSKSKGVDFFLQEKNINGVFIPNTSYFYYQNNVL